MKANIALLLFSLLFCVLGAEFLLRFSPANSFRDGQNVYKQQSHHEALLGAYTAKEQDKDLGTYTEQGGAHCVAIAAGDSMSYHPYFGFNQKTLDDNCAREHLSTSATSLVFLGGSVMANAMAPNHLSTIDYFIHQQKPETVSVNLAESGARSTNELIRLLLEVVELKPSTIVFLDGFNEFNSIRYGGDPADDFYWTAGVERRLHDPVSFLSGRVIEKSALLKALLWGSGIVPSPPRVQKAAPSKASVIESAEVYIRNVRKAQKICEAYQIRCLFFLQPHIFSKDVLTSGEQKIAALGEASFPGYREVLAQGYAHIIATLGNEVIDLRTIYDGEKGDIYFDEVHLNKRGNEILAKQISLKL